MAVVVEAAGSGDEDGPLGTHRVVVAADPQVGGAIGRETDGVADGVGEQQPEEEEEEGGGKGSAHSDVSGRSRDRTERLGGGGGILIGLYCYVARALQFVLFLMD